MNLRASADGFSHLHGPEGIQTHREVRRRLTRAKAQIGRPRRDVSELSGLRHVQIRRSGRPDNDGLKFAWCFYKPSADGVTQGLRVEGGRHFVGNFPDRTGRGDKAPPVAAHPDTERSTIGGESGTVG